MAIGTVTVGTHNRIPLEQLHMVNVSFAGDSAYSAGGTATFSKLTAIFNAIGGKKLLAVIPVGACGGYVPRYDFANDKLMVYEGNYDAADGPMQESSTSNLSGVTFQLLLIAA